MTNFQRGVGRKADNFHVFRPVFCGPVAEDVVFSDVLLAFGIDIHTAAAP